MDSQILGIKTTTPEPRVLPENAIKHPESVKPIPKDKGGLSGGFGKKPTKKQDRKPSTPSSDKTKDRNDETQSALSDVKMSASLELYDKTGDLVVKTMNLGTKELIQHVPSEGFLKSREKLEKLRGAFFTCKA